MDQLRETPPGHREDDVLEYGRSAACHFVQSASLGGRPAKTRGLRATPDGVWLHEEAGHVAIRVVYEGA